MGPQKLPTSPQPDSFWERDGLVISGDLTEDAAEALLDEHGELRQRIHSEYVLPLKQALLFS